MTRRCLTTIGLCVLLLGCQRKQEPAPVSGSLPQRGYLWQRDWTPAVNAALGQGSDALDGVIILGAEIEWREGAPQISYATIDWPHVHARTNARSIAVRLAPLPKPPPNDDQVVRILSGVFRSLILVASAGGFEWQELQLDYDCPEKELARYRGWVRRLRNEVRPMHFTITALPSWLDQPELGRLVGEVDGWVLQVHSVPTSKDGIGQLCDPAAARNWVKKAARLRLPFAVALPTYRCAAGYDQKGHLLGVAMDSVQPAWPPETRVLEFSANAEQIAALTNEWLQARPPELRELIWYRLPVATDTRNWRWPTLRAVMAGRRPRRQFAVDREGENPVDLALRNTGESDDDKLPAIVACWQGADLLASDALAGFAFSRDKSCATFRVGEGHRVHLPPGASRQIGWLRFSASTQLTLETSNEKQTIR